MATSHHSSNPKGRIRSYRFGFNGQLKDSEVYGEGNAYTAMFWEYDSRIGRRWNLDPLAIRFVWQSPYAAFNNNPILLNDPLGNTVDNDYQANSDGSLTLLTETDDKFDVIYNEDKSKSVQVDKGFIKDSFSGKSNHSWSGVTPDINIYVTNDVNKGRDVFGFLADNTDVEWSFQVYSKDNDSKAVISTSHEPFQSAAVIDVQDMVLNNSLEGYENYSLAENWHSHTRNKGSDYPSGYDFKTHKSDGSNYSDFSNMYYTLKDFKDKGRTAPDQFYLYVPSAGKIVTYNLYNYGDGIFK